MRLLIPFVLFWLYACGQQPDIKRHFSDPLAKKLVDSALIIGYQEAQYEKAITLLNQAIQIDSNYATPYTYKLSFQWQLKKYDSALTTANTLIRIRPKNPDQYVQIGLLYDQKGDTISSKKFYEEAISRYDDILDTMSTKNKSYNYFLMSKAIDLVFLERQKEGNELFKKLSDNESNQFLKDYYSSLINKSKNEILKILESNNSASAVSVSTSD